MARRIDYFDDPNAPAVNSVIPAANVVIADDQGRILMIKRTDNGNWAIPGGTMEMGESIVDTAIREVLEETGITCKVTGIVGTYTDPRHVVLFTSNNEVRQEFAIVFAGEYVSGEPTPSSESSEVHWLDRDVVLERQMDRSMRLRIGDYLNGDGTLHLG
jgi:8-oxo-dGTP pyrophosphatase MutT (NUDIX family)